VDKQGVSRNPDLSRDELLELGDENLVGFIRHMARAGAGGVVTEECGLLLVAGSHPNPGPYRNLAIRIRNELSAEESMRVADEFFAARARGYVFWIRAHADADLAQLAQGRGLSLLEPEGLPELYRQGAPEPVEPAPDVDLTWADDEKKRIDFLNVNAEAWGIGNAPDELKRNVLFEPSTLDAPTVSAAMAYIDGQPASTSMAIEHPEFVAGGYWGATAHWARRRGLHDLTTRAAFNARLQLGARHFFCQNSPLAAKNVERMGFGQLTRYWRYRVPARKSHTALGGKEKKRRS
jgi:hypothetical protein